MYGKNIRYLRKKFRLHQGDLASMLGLKSFTTIQHWETEHSQPNLGQLKILSDYFGFSIQDIVYTDLELAAGNPGSKISRKLAVLGHVAASAPIYAIENVIDYIDFNNHGDFALKIKGDSMEPRLFEGDLVVVAKDDEIKNGDMVIVVINGDEAICKIIKFVNEGLMLTSLNPSYEPLFFSKKEINDLPVTIVGRVVESRAKY